MHTHNMNTEMYNMNIEMSNKNTEIVDVVDVVTVAPHRPHRRQNLLLMIVVAIVAIIALAALILSIIAIVKWHQSSIATLPRELTTVGPTTSDPLQIIIPNDSNYDAYLEATKQLSSTMNTDINKCNNFWNYACGSFSDDQLMSFNEAQNSIFEHFVHQISSKTYSAVSTPLPLKQTVWFFHRCVEAAGNRTGRNQEGSAIIDALKAFQQVTGLPFPMLNQQQNQETWPDKTTLGTALGYLNGQMEINTLLSYFIDTNWKAANSSASYLLYIDQNLLMMDKARYQPYAWQKFEAGYIEEIRSTMTKLVKLMNLTLDSKTLEEDIHGIKEIELVLARNLSTDYSTRQQVARSYNPMTVENANNYYDFIDWMAYFKQLTAKADTSVQEIVSTPTFIFSLIEKTNILQLKSAFKINNEYKFTPRQLVNYLMYRVVDHFADFPRNKSDASERRSENRKFIGKTSNIISSRPWEWDPLMLKSKNLTNEEVICAEETMHLPFTNARILVDKLYPDKGVFIRKTIGKMITSIVNEFQSMIDDLTWMDDETKESASGKVKNLVQNGAFPEFILDDSKLTDYYSSLKINENDSFATMLSEIKAFNLRNNFNYLLKNYTDRSDFTNPPALSNAWYQPQLNSITIPIGILLPPFYHPQYPASINYGALGITIGHEIVHAFDNSGVQWDSIGHLRQWMTNTSEQGFQRLADCVTDEYYNFCPLNFMEYTPNCVNGAQTLGENIADNGGIHAAWRAYQKHVELYGPDLRLPAPLSHLSHDQLFFLSFGRVWCVSDPVPNPDMYKILLSSPHSPHKYRVMGVLQNFPAFQSAFNCRPLFTSSGNTDKHCNVWVSDNRK